MAVGAIALLLTIIHGYTAEASPRSKTRATVITGKQVEKQKPASVQLLTFPNTEWSPVKIVRGGTNAKDAAAESEPSEKQAAAEIVSFADPNTKPVRVLRGDGEHSAAAGRSPLATGMHSELVAFADPRFRPVTVLRGPSTPSLSPAIGLFGPAREADLDRVAFAVEGAESSHGTDPRMWSPGVERSAGADAGFCRGRRGCRRRQPVRPP